MASHGHLETRWTAAFPDLNLTFRNLGWSGDTPAGISRAGLSEVQAGREKPDEGWKQLCRLLDQTRPDVVVMGYGMASALEDHAARRETTAAFTADFQRLIDKLRQQNPKLRWVFLSPLTPHGKCMLSDNTIARYANAIQELARQNNGVFVDLKNVAMDDTLRIDPLHLNEAGYRTLADHIVKKLGFASEDLEAANNPAAKSSAANNPAALGDDIAMRKLRQAILEKNRYWFHRWRPSNMAYVFGFRKHEQGQNAQEIPQFDTLIAEQEQRIAMLRKMNPTDSSTRDEPVLKSRFAEFTPQSRPAFTVHEGWKIELWAENPLLNKPVHMNFDTRGRLWIASSEAYPMIEVGQSPPDKILVLEDTNDDGHADQSTVFADGLLIPTGVLPYRNGCYVAQSAELLYLEDTDNDGRADRRTVVLSGFGTEDTHHNLHTLMWSDDGRLCMNQSVYTRSDLETPWGVVRLRAGGGFRMNPDNSHTRIFFRGLWNPWGHTQNALGQSFMTDGAGFEGIAYVFDGAVFRPTPGATRTLDLISPGSYPKFCGAAIVAGPSVPADWAGSLLTCDFRANRVTRFDVRQQNAGFTSEPAADLVRTSESTFRPIDIKHGPDGALYIADWSNPIINHGEVDFRDPRRDRWHGRIWRMSQIDAPEKTTRWTGPQAAAHQDLAALVEAYFGDDTSKRGPALEMLIERFQTDAGVVDVVRENVVSERDRLRACRFMARCEQAEFSMLQPLFASADPAIRAAAIRVLADGSQPGDPSASIDAAAAMRLLQSRVHDDNAAVRLDAVVALGRLGTREAICESLAVLDHPLDRFIQHALLHNVEAIVDQWETILQQDEWSTPAFAKRLEFVLESVPAAKAARWVDRHVNQHGVSADGPWIELIGKAGGRDSQNRLLVHVLSDRSSDQTKRRGLRSLQRAAERTASKKQAGPEGLQQLESLLRHDEPDIATASMRVLSAWNRQASAAAMGAIAADPSRTIAVRQAAIEALDRMNGKASRSALRPLAFADLHQDQSDRPIDAAATEVSLRRQALAAFAKRYPAESMDAILKVLQTSTDDGEARLLWNAVLQSKRGRTLVAEGLANVQLSPLALKVAQQLTTRIGRDAAPLAELLNAQSGAAEPRQWTADETSRLLRLASDSGDPHRGELIYRRSALQCVGCHAIGGVGGNVGPDMSSLGASAPLDYLFESLIDPGAKVKEGYHSVAMMLDDGRVLTGIEVDGDDAKMGDGQSGSDNDVRILKQPDGSLQRVAKIEIVATKPSSSLMPSGLIDSLDEQEQADLLAFLSRLGKPGEFDASRKDVARSLRVFAGTHRAEQSGTADLISGERKTGWKGLLSRVSGDIPREDLQRLTAQPRNISLVNVYLEASFETTRRTPVTIELAGVNKADCWIDGEAVPWPGCSEPIPPGIHRLLIRLDARALPETVRVGSQQATFIAVDGDAAES